MIESEKSTDSLVVVSGSGVCPLYYQCTRPGTFILNIKGRVFIWYFSQSSTGIPEWVPTKSMIKTRISKCRSRMSKRSSLTMTTIETVGINMVTMILIDWKRGTNYGFRHCHQRNKWKIATGHGYIYTPCILDYEKHMLHPYGGRQ